jgi:hypothetical protein
VETCAIAHYPNTQQWLPFIHCLEENGGNIMGAVQQCAAASGLDFATLEACYTGPEGAALELAAANATVPHTFVPWTTINNGKTFCSNSDCDNFVTALCKAYTGPKPASCTKAGGAGLEPVQAAAEA